MHDDHRHEPGGPRNGWRREALRALAVVAVFALLVYLARDWFAALEANLAGLGFWAPLAFVAGHVVVVSLGFPVSVLGFLAGATFGVLGGTALLLVAGLVAASVMFLVARRLLATRVRRFVARRPRLDRFVALAEADAWRIMALLRLSPLHYALVCYLLGASRVRFWPYLVTSLLVLPSAVLQAYLGHAAESIGRRAAEQGALDPLDVAPAVVSAVAAVLLLVVMGRLARRALEETAGLADAKDDRA